MQNNHTDTVNKLGQEDRFFDSGVAAANHDNIEVFIEVGITGGAVGNTFGGVFALAFDTQNTGIGTSADNDTLGQQGLPITGFDTLEKTIALHAQTGDQTTLEFHAEPIAMVTKHLHKVRAC